MLHRPSTTLLIPRKLISALIGIILESRCLVCSREGRITWLITEYCMACAPGPTDAQSWPSSAPTQIGVAHFLGFRVLYSFMKRLVVVPASIFGWRVAIKDLTYGNDDELESWVVNLVLATPTKRPQRSCESQGLYSIDQG